MVILNQFGLLSVYSWAYIKQKVILAHKLTQYEDQYPRDSIARFDGIERTLVL